MFAVIFAHNDKQKAKALELGYREQTVLIKHTFDKAEAERELFEKIQPGQFAVTTYWGAGVD